MARKVKTIQKEHQIVGRELIEAIESIAFSRDIPVDNVIYALTTNIRDVIVRQNPKEFKYANISVSLNKQNGYLDIHREYKIVSEYGDTYEQNCKEITKEDIILLIQDVKDESYITIFEKEGVVHEKLDFKFERKVFQDLKGATKGEISLIEKQNKFEKLKEEGLTVFTAIITNIKKGKMYLNYRDLEFILPFGEFDKHDNIKSYEIGKKITVAFSHEEVLHNSVKYYVTKKSNKLIPQLFNKYNYAAKMGDFVIGDVIPMYQNNGYKLVITDYRVSKQNVINVILKNKSVDYIRAEIGLEQGKNNLILLFGKDVSEFIINYFHKIKISKMIFDEVKNMWIIVVENKDDKLSIIRDIKTLYYWVNKIYNPNSTQKIRLQVATEQELNEDEKIQEERVVKFLVQSLNIADNEARILYQEYFDTIEIIAYSNEDEFVDVIDLFTKINSQLSIQELQKKAKQFLIDNPNYVNEQINPDIYDLNLSSEEMKVLLDNHQIKSKSDVADLDAFELQEILNCELEYAQNIILTARK